MTFIRKVVIITIVLNVIQSTISNSDIDNPIAVGAVCDSTQHLCKNGATCINFSQTVSMKRFKCICINGFNGEFCENNVNDCIDNLCEAGSTCIDGIAKYTCVCPVGKIGLFCQLDDPCILKPCKGNSECLVDTASGRYQCECQKGFMGDDCSKDINECEWGETSLCFNGGTCVNTKGSWYCECRSEYKGRNCMEHVDLCKVNPCRNGGICIDYGSHMICLCETGFYGGLCEGKCMPGSEDAICIEYENSIKATDSEVPRTIEQYCKDHKCETKSANRICDEECNRYECNYDSGDCSAHTKPFSACNAAVFCSQVFHDSKCDPACATEECLFDGFDCTAHIERCPLEELCKTHYSNGICDDVCNNAACLYDGGDCDDRKDSKHIMLPGRLILVLLVDPKEFLYRASAFLFVLSHTLRVSVHIAMENGHPMVYSWSLESGQGAMFNGSVNEYGAHMQQGNGTRGTLVILTVDTSLCLADDCFSNLNYIASYLGAAYASHQLQIPIYSARADIPSKESEMRNKVALLTIATMGTLIVSLLAIQLIRKRRMIRVTKTWFPPAHDSCTLPIANFEGNSVKSDIWNLEGGSISKRIPSHTITVTIPELFPDKETTTHSPVPISEIPSESNRWTTPLHVEASSMMAISLPINLSYVNVRDEMGRTPLMRTAVNLSKAEWITVEDLRNLLSVGALIDEQDDNEESALLLAVKAGRCTVVRYLLERGADVGLQDASDRIALHHAIALCALPLVEMLIVDRNVNVNALDDSNCTPLMMCAKHEMVGVDMAELLLRFGADVNMDGRKIKPNYSGRTALHYAAQLCNLDMIRLLIRSGANKDAQDVEGQTPLFLATSEGHVEAVELLVSVGSSKEITDCKERSPKDIAVEKNFREIVERLTAHSIGGTDKRLSGSDKMHFKKNSKQSKRPLVRKVRPTTNHRIVPLEFLTPPQSDTSMFLSPIQTLKNFREQFSSGDAQTASTLLSPPYELTFNRSLFSNERIPNYNEWQQNVVRRGSDTDAHCSRSIDSTTTGEMSRRSDGFGDDLSGYYV